MNFYLLTSLLLRVDWPADFGRILRFCLVSGMIEKNSWSRRGHMFNLWEVKYKRQSKRSKNRQWLLSSNPLFHNRRTVKFKLWSILRLMSFIMAVTSQHITVRLRLASFISEESPQRWKIIQNHEYAWTVDWSWTAHPLSDFCPVRQRTVNPWCISCRRNWNLSCSTTSIKSPT